VLLFSAGGVRYALACRHVREVLQRTPLRCVPGAPREVSGLLSYRGRAVPVIDLVRMLTGEPCRSAYSSRLVVVEWRGLAGEPQLVGVEVEEATETTAIRESSLVPSPIQLTESAWLGPLIRAEEGDAAAWGDNRLVQMIEVERLLRPEIAALLRPADDTPQPEPTP
jgi:chemotaxis-related protein WspB